jgi:MtrB/PioB family decaheme-associated outer membrane protein
MNNRNRLPFQLSAASTLVLAAAGVLAQEADRSAETAEDYAPLAVQNRPLTTSWINGYNGVAQLGFGYVSDDNFMFGQYNGLHEEGAVLIGNLQWQDFSRGDSYWEVAFSDLGLDTREGTVTWGLHDRLRIRAGFDSQLQVRNNTGRTPFTGSDTQQLPTDWVSGISTDEWSMLNESLRQFDRELSRDRLFIGADASLNENWKLVANLSYEDKEGYGDVGGGIYIDAASADTVLLRAPVDYRTTEFDLGLSYSGERLHLSGQFDYSDFDNKDDLLSWQNPYSSYGPAVAYSSGFGGLGTAPDNERMGARLTGHYLFSTTTRLQFDGSYAVASQDQGYLDYSVNPALRVNEPVPRNNFDGEVATTTINARLLMRPLPGLNLEAFYQLRDRDYDVPRDGYNYIRGDGGNQPAPAFTVYNTANDFISQAAGFEAGYRLPLRSRLSFEYEYENIQRRNAAVEETEEDRFTLAYRIQPWDSFSARLSLLYADRAADTYRWDQDYYALLDTRLINATPDNQRYNNHPELSQYYLANRERWEGKVDLGYLPSQRWNLNLNMLWRDDDFDKTNLGLTASQWQRVHFSASFAASDALSASVYAGWDRYESDQTGRAFRGGQEKNAFDSYPPLPQASDPGRDWDVAIEDTSTTLGANLSWQWSPAFAMRVDYHYVDTESAQALGTRAGSGLADSDLPDVETSLHQVEANGIWALRDNLSLQIDYRYFRYSSDDWARRNVRADTISKVLTFGERNPNEQIHYLGASVIYRWQ